MTIEQEIAALCAQADELRPLPEDEPAKAPLAGIIDAINALRAKQARGDLPPSAQEARAEAMRKPGRKPKIEGADA